MIAEPTMTIVIVCPRPHSAPMSAASKHPGLVTDDRSDGHYVIGIRGVPHPQEQSQCYNGE